jgi:hypothetical protein
MALRFACIVVGCLACLQSRSACSAEETVIGRAAKLDLKPLLEQVGRLVKRYYPKAEVTSKEELIHVEYGTRVFVIHSLGKDGIWLDAHQERGPQKGGIYADLEIREGEYEGQAALPQAFDLRYFTSFLMAPYSKKLDRHLYIHLKYPKDVPDEFLKEFRALVNDFDKHVKVEEKK